MTSHMISAHDFGASDGPSETPTTAAEPMQSILYSAESQFSMQKDGRSCNEKTVGVALAVSRYIDRAYLASWVHRKEKLK